MAADNGHIRSTIRRVSIVSKHIIYIPQSDTVMMDGGQPYMASKDEAQRVIDHETVGKRKVYEVKPASFLKKWLEREKGKERQGSKHKFNPPDAEIRYVHPDGQPRFVVVYSDSKNQGTMVTCLDTKEDAVKFIQRNFNKLAKEVPDAGLFVLDTEKYSYVHSARSNTASTV